MDSLILRNAEAKDVKEIAALEKVCFSDPWSEDLVRADVVDNSDISTYILAENHKDEIIGYIGIWTVAEECQINNVAVRPDYRNQGIGALLVGTVLTASEDAGIKYWTLEVRETNEAAITLYKHMGFKEIARRPKYYDDGEACLVMAKGKRNEG